MKRDNLGYLFSAFNAMALGFFSTLIIGVILEELGNFFMINQLVYYGSMVKFLMGPAVGVAIAMTRKAKGMTLITSVVAGAIGAGTIASSGIQIGDPIGAFVTSVIAIEVAMLIENKTSFDIFLIPVTVILVSSLTAIFISPIFMQITAFVGDVVMKATDYQPFMMGVVIAVVMGMALTAPISSAAIAIALGLSGIAAGAAAVGCATQMIGIAVMSKEDNKFSDVIAIAIGTSMLQFTNIIKNPLLWLPPILASAILGPVSTVVFKLQTNAYGAGMGTSGLVGPLTTLRTMGNQYLVIIILMFFVFPAIITLLFYLAMKQLKWIKKGQLKIQKTF